MLVWSTLSEVFLPRGELEDRIIGIDDHVNIILNI